MTLTESDIDALISIRRDLHTKPELSGKEAATAKTITQLLTAHSPSRLVTDIGGHGVVAEFDSGRPGPTLLFRCELDGLPIEELSDHSYRSTHAGRGHLCGHDGHMTILLGLATLLKRDPIQRGRIVLLFQPAEETGEGAKAVLADPNFDPFVPDFAYALHNLPGLERGHVASRAGPVNCASMGLQLRLEGVTAHASSPEEGRSPASAVARLIDYFSSLAPGGPLDDDYALVTLVHAELGERAHGIAPGHGEVWATLRTLTDDRMDRLVRQAVTFASATAAAEGLVLQNSTRDIFSSCINNQNAIEVIQRSAETADLPYRTLEHPMRFSEDFGRFAIKCRSAMFFLGSGREQHPLHHPRYDFPDRLIEPGVAIFKSIVNDHLNTE